MALEDDIKAIAKYGLGKPVLVVDEIANKLDELADICEYWKRQRERGRNPNAIRNALVMLSQEVSALAAND